MPHTIGVLAFHGDVLEHIETTINAARRVHLPIRVIPVRTKEELSQIHALIIPGGESTTLYKLCVRENIWEDMKKVKNIFGTCAGAIMLANNVLHKTSDQNTLELMDIKIDRNAYGRQTDSFEKNIITTIGNIHAVFIRAPRVVSIGKNVKILAKINNEVIACEERLKHEYYLASCFHPEMTSTVFHEYFLRQCGFSS